MSDHNTFHLTGVIVELQERTSAKGTTYSSFKLRNTPEGSRGGPFDIPLVTFGRQGKLLTNGIANNGTEIEVDGTIAMRSNVSPTNGKTYFNIELNVVNFKVLRQAKWPDVPVEPVVDRTKEDDLMASLPF